MIYTLLNFLVWGLLLAFIGGVVGWALRSLQARGGRVQEATADVGELDEMRERLVEFDAVVAERDRLRMQVADMRHADSPGVVGAREAPSSRGHVDLDAAREVIGKEIAFDDLTVIDGIGPRIAELLAGIGVSTWAGLACTDQATLHSMLDDAGFPHRTRDPSSWPRQAALLAAGRWDDFAALDLEPDDR